MEIPPGIKTFDNGLAILWWDEGILFSLSKKNIPMTKDALEKAFDVIEKISAGKKVCLLADMSFSSAPDNKTAYDYAVIKMEKLVKAHAMVASTPLSKMLANLYLYLKKPPYPSKIFNNVKDAKEWLKQFL